MLGRPSGYRPEFAPQAEKLCKLGATDVEIADFFEVSVRTVYRWLAEFDDFCHALKVGKEAFDDRIERSLYHRATGYSFDSEKIFCNKDGEVTRVQTREHVPPDTTACIFWLKNRRPELWREKHEVNVTHELTDSFSDEELAHIARDGGKGTSAAKIDTTKLN